MLRRLCAERSRDPSELEIVINPTGGPNDLPALQALGVSEVVVYAEPPAAPQLVPEWTAELGQRWIGSATIQTRGTVAEESPSD